MGYQAEHRKSIENPEDFWGNRLKKLTGLSFHKRFFLKIVTNPTAGLKAVN